MKKVKLGEVATFINGYAFKPQDWSSEGKEIIRIQNLTKTSKETNYYSGTIDKKYIIEAGDILISWSGTLGVFQWCGKPAVLNQHIFKVVFDKIDIDKSYFKYVVEKGLQDAIKHTHGSTMKHLTKKYFDNIMVSYTNLREQQRIASELDLLSKLILRRQEQLKGLNLLVKFPIFRGGGCVKKVKLGEICEIVTGSTPKSSNPNYWNGEYKWITPAEISDDDFIVFDTQRKITKLGIEETGLKSFPTGTVLLSSRAPIGKVAIAGCEMYCNQGFKNFICSNKINNEYLYYFFKSRKNYLNILGRGATFKEISKSLVSDIEILLPTYDIQRKQVKVLKKIDKLIYTRKEQFIEFEYLVKSRYFEEVVA